MVSNAVKVSLCNTIDVKTGLMRFGGNIVSVDTSAEGLQGLAAVTA